MSGAAPAALGRRARWTLIGIAVGVVAVFAAANTHLVWVSLASQPECVPHLKEPDGSGAAFRAATSSC